MTNDPNAYYPPETAPMPRDLTNMYPTTSANNGTAAPVTSTPAPAPDEDDYSQGALARDKVTQEMSPHDRLTRLENLFTQYFGTHHFEPPPKPYDPEAAREAARRRYIADMEAIDASAPAPRRN